MVRRGFGGRQFAVRYRRRHIRGHVPFPKLFDRFYRTDASRSHESGGFGLGLYIARTAMRRLGGAISANLGSGGVVTFTLVFPSRR
ncbi:MAG: cell wall metabolism sensor histidine kinase WalK [Oscillospiraceae bacterium]|nr:cell wall metabolism sensor histidine kinase WalK [Oscillospiraceae bacterium]